MISFCLRLEPANLSPVLLTYSPRLNVWDIGTNVAKQQQQCVFHLSIWSFVIWNALYEITKTWSQSLSLLIIIIWFLSWLKPYQGWRWIFVKYLSFIKMMIAMHRETFTDRGFSATEPSITASRFGDSGPFELFHR